MDREQIRTLAKEMREVLDLGIEVLKKHGVEADPVVSIGISADGYMNMSIQDAGWTLIRCAGEEHARLKMEEVL